MPACSARRGQYLKYGLPTSPVAHLLLCTQKHVHDYVELILTLVTLFI